MLLNKWKMMAVVFGVSMAIGLLPLPAQCQYGENMSPQVDSPVSYLSHEGQFDILFPPGCPEIHVKSPTVAAGEMVPFVYVYCDKYGKKGEGCDVSTWFDVVGPEGGNPTRAQLDAKIEEALTKFGVGVVKQVELSIESECGIKMEGVDLLTQTQDAVGQVWLRGLIVEGRVYLITAWRSEGNLLSQPGTQAYFQSFAPLCP